MLELLQKYSEISQEIYEKLDVDPYYSLLDYTGRYWKINIDGILYAKNPKDLDDNGDNYYDVEPYGSNKITRVEDITYIIGDDDNGGDPYCYIFSNNKEVVENE